jgi:hypothetical protein
MFKPSIYILDLNHALRQLRPDFETTIRHASLQWSLKTLGLPHMSRQPKAIAGDGFDANVCADVYNLHVTKKYICEACIFLVGNSFTVLWIVGLSTI